MKKFKALHKFYKSSAWLAAREIKIMSVNSLCERCGQVGIEVHHIERLTIENINDSRISLNQDNLELLCRECHNQEHKRFCKKVRFDESGNLINSKITSVK